MYVIHPHYYIFQFYKNDRYGQAQQVMKYYHQYNILGTAILSSTVNNNKYYIFALQRNVKNGDFIIQYKKIVTIDTSNGA